jgi:sterol desaturase/sphingolipid hydroxylase (fatty acid hydroxylase superfamily)
MSGNKIEAKSWLSLSFALTIFLKDVLVTDLEIIPLRSPVNRLISWFVILPLFIWGLIIAVVTIRNYMLAFLNHKKSGGLINLLLSMSVAIYFFLSWLVYFFWGK